MASDLTTILTDAKAAKGLTGSTSVTVYAAVILASAIVWATLRITASVQAATDAAAPAIADYRTVLVWQKRANIANEAYAITSREAVQVQLGTHHVVGGRVVPR